VFCNQAFVFNDTLGVANCHLNVLTLRRGSSIAQCCSIRHSLVTGSG